jgi:hypothetical protein
MREAAGSGGPAIPDAEDAYNARCFVLAVADLLFDALIRLFRPAFDHVLFEPTGPGLVRKKICKIF